MAQTIYEVLDELRQSATSEADKGSKLELLIASYLRTDPVYADQFSDVWLWQDWPGRNKKHDTGIDIVATDRLSGGLVAIQCKFFAPESTISKPDIDSFLSASGKEGFEQRIIVSTTERWNANAEDAIRAQQVPVRRIGLSDLEASPVDWSRFSLSTPEVLPISGKKSLRKHQEQAISSVLHGFETHDRGKLIMACGTGKTFTALRLAETFANAGSSVLFLVPSISLLSQSYREWLVEASVPISPLAVCSDRKASATAINEDISSVDIALPATTDSTLLAKRIRESLKNSRAITVVFATYQSIDVVARAQQDYDLPEFDLILCDEAHRTTGKTLADEDESAFQRVHRNDYIRGCRRLYMTATPRIYDDSAKARAGEANAVIASMDDESVYGPELYHLGFGEAVNRDLLTDYKVLVLAVDETAIAKTFQLQLAEDGELKLDDAAKIVGCWNGLAKRGRSEHSFLTDPTPMKRAVAFSGTIKSSQKIESLFSTIVDQYASLGADCPDNEPMLRSEVRHVDGSFNALQRNARLDWLRGDIPNGHCRILTNARCLSEGVDVPALDAVMFLSPRKSTVDIVQSVGRVMRKAAGKKYGYIILPIGVPYGVTPEQALRDNTRYAAVWEVLQALRAHDERFDAMINRIDLTSARDEKINVIGVDAGERLGDVQSVQESLALSFAGLDEWRNALYAKIVEKVGSRRYWQEWASDIADIAMRHITRISALLEHTESNVREEFETFLEGLRGNLNEGISETDAIDMLAQHLITRPVFDALFSKNNFTTNNPVSKAMERMLTVLDEHALDDENATLEKFYESVRMRADGVDTAEGRQRLIVELYDTFFKTAFPQTVAKLGIVYTPVEVVDFILKTADRVLRETFDQGVGDEGVHLLDGFVGTGTFIVRLLQSGLIEPSDLARKYADELHANEILLLAYYIAAANIETAYQELSAELSMHESYQPFEGLVLADTFQMYEAEDEDDLGVFPENNERLNKQRGLPITVIVGNPPYSAGQDSANANNRNETYPHLDARIRETYAAKSNAKLKNKLYDSYSRAFKWASLRVGDRGAIVFVTNGGFLDDKAFNGMRKSLVEEFSQIWVLNLRGNQRTAGEQSKREGGKIFDAGSRATVAITALVKDPNHVGPATIKYAVVDDYLTREQKLDVLSRAGDLMNVAAVQVAPDETGDWINQRTDQFASFVAPDQIFGLISNGVNTGRDAWVYGSSRDQVVRNMENSSDAYNSEVARWAAEHGNMKRRPSEAEVSAFVSRDPRRISWSSNLLQNVGRGTRSKIDPGRVRISVYRPFFKQYLYFDQLWNSRPGRSGVLFPTPEHQNIGIYVVGANSTVPFSALMLDATPNLHVTGAGSGGSFFPRWRYESPEQGAIFSVDTAGELIDGYSRIDNITDESLVRFRGAYGDSFTKDDIFHYAYGVFHSNDYRETYAADLKKLQPRLPIVANPTPFLEAGRTLADLHLRYEELDPYPLAGLNDGPDDRSDAAYLYYYVQKMAFVKVRVDGKLRADESTIRYNSHITLRGVPEDALRYLIGSRSAVEWVFDRYRMRKDPDSGLINDPNDLSREAKNPRFILDLLARIVTLSVETVKIVDSLPDLEIFRE